MSHETIHYDGIRYGTIGEMIAEIKQLRNAVATPIPELEGTFPLVLYFGNRADMDEFVRLIKEAKPRLVSRSLK